MAELFTKDIANEYIEKARNLALNDMQDIGERRKLRLELQDRCGLTELEAINIMNGYHIADYLVTAKRREKERLRKEQEERQCG